MKLIYFDARGLIEQSRIMLKIAGIPFEEVRLPMKLKEGGGFITEEFVAQKAAGDFYVNMDRVPILIVDGVTIGQSKAIDRFVAKRCNMLGQTDLEAAQIDCITEHIRDIKDKYIKVKSLPAAEKDEGLMKWFAKDLPEQFAKLEKSLPATRSAGFCIGSTISYADVFLWCFACDYFDDKASAIAALAGCESLKAIVSMVGDKAPLKTWLAERPNNFI